MPNLQNKTLLVFTGGGLAPALNPTLYGVITAARKSGMKVLGGMYGWASLMREGKIIDLTNLDIEAIKNIGGTFLRSSRTNPLKAEGGIAQIRQTIAKYNINYVVVIGGDDTLGAALKLFEDYDLPIVGIPKTIDNDISGTYWTPGFPSAAYYFADLVRKIKIDAAYALSRVFVIEAYGMHAGWLASAGALGGADVIVPPEKKADLDKFLQTVARRYHNNSKFAVVVVAQQADFGEAVCGLSEDQWDDFQAARQKLICLNIKEEIKNKLGLESRMIYPANYVESGPPVALDRDLSITLGEEAIKLIQKGAWGTMPSIIRPDWSSSELTVSAVSLREAVGDGKCRRLDDSFFDFKEFKVKDKFFNYLAPAFGPLDATDAKYFQLIKKINK